MKQEMKENLAKTLPIEGHLSALKELLKEPSNRDLIKPMLLDFNDEDEHTDEEIEEVVRKKGNEKAATANPGAKGKAVVADEDLSKPFKEVLKCSFTKRIIEFSASGHKLPTNAKIYDDDYVRSEEAFHDTELPRGESDHRSFFRPQGNHAPYVASYRPQHNFPHPREHHKDNRTVLTLDPLLDIALGSGKLNYLVTDVRQKGKGGQKGSGPQKGKIINMVDCVMDSQKRKSKMIDEDWMNVPIVFPPVHTRDLLEEAIMVEAEIEGYLVRWVHVDEGASLEIMYEHYFNMLHPAIKLRLTETHTIISGF
ncbi:hypothetical protein Tco_0264362 [Tanacetum coccineum]